MREKGKQTQVNVSEHLSPRDNYDRLDFDKTSPLDVSTLPISHKQGKNIHLTLMVLKYPNWSVN